MVGDVDSEGGFTYKEAEVHGKSVLSIQFYSEPKIALRN